MSSQYPQYSTQKGVDEEDDNENEGDQTRRKKWEQNDDKLLIFAWLRVSKDPIIGNNQPLQKFWQRIHQEFEEGQVFEKNKNSQKRTWQQCKARWSKISKDVMKFGAYYDQIKRRGQSGKNEHDYIKDAHDLFKQNENKICMVEHCWVLLRNEPKWMSEFGNTERSASKRTKVNASGAYTSSSSSKDVSINDEINESPIRPTSRATAKKKGKEKANNSEKADQMIHELQELTTVERSKFDLLREYNEQNKIELEATKEKERRKQEKERRKQIELERSIIMVDTSNMDNMQKEWIEDMRREIMSARKSH